MRLTILGFALFFMLFAFHACTDEPHKIPEITFDFTIDIDMPEYSDLSSVLGYAYVTGGAYENGIIIYRKNFEEFYAYDRSCPYNPKNGILEVSKDNEMIATDTVCGSKFNLFQGGSIIKGPAKRSLKQYQTQFNPNSNLLRVYN